MGTYNLPRDVKGEGRILFIFTTKSILWTAGFGLFGLIFYIIFSLILEMKLVGIIITLVFAFIGFAIGTFKIPNITTISWLSKNAGQTLDDILIRAIKFKQKGNKIYIYNKEEKANDK